MSQLLGPVQDLHDQSWGAVTGSTAAAESSLAAANIAAESEREKLEYLRETERVPQALREAGLTGLGAEYGMTFDNEGNLISDGSTMVERAKASPLYAGLMEGGARGEDAIMRNASMTGGLRSGNTSANLWDYNAELQNNALLTSYNDQVQGIRGLAQLPSNANAIGGSIGNVGSILGQGLAGAGQARADGQGQALSAGIAGLAAFFSDQRLKKNKKKVGSRYGFDWFTWDWNDIAEKLGLTGSSEGVMADLVQKVRPDLIGERDGFMTVDYGRLADSGLVKELH